MLVLKSLTLKNIGRFTTPQTIDFEPLGSLTQIEGNNRNTGGSSGSGKSTIFKALEFLLGLNSISTNVLQSRLTKDQISVSAIFDYDGKSLIIERGKKLSIEINGVITTGSSKVTEELLDQILGMPRDLFRKTMHKRQSEGGFFLQMAPSETHSFLTGCLGLEAEQAKILTIDTLLTSLRGKEIDLNTSLQNCQTGLEATNNAIKSMPPAPTLDIGEHDVNRLQGEYSHRGSERGILSFKNSKELESLETLIRSIEKVELERQDSIKTQIVDLRNLMHNLNKEELLRQREVERTLSDHHYEKTYSMLNVNLGKKAKEEAKTLIEELKKIKESTCPTCSQTWSNELSLDKEAEILLKLKICRRSITEGENANITLLKMEPIVDQLKKDLEPRVTLEMMELDGQIGSLIRQLNSEDLNRYRKTHDELSKDLSTLKEAHRIKLSKAENDEQTARSKYEYAKNRLLTFEENKKKFDESNVKLIRQATHYHKQIDLILSQIDSIKQELEIAEEAKKAIKSYLSCSFDDALESIGDVATTILRGIPNMSTATISLEGLKETANGKIKEEVNATISMDGELSIPIKSLSGGERSATDLAIDLSVVRFIGEKTGQGINIMILDEFTNGLDSVCIQEVIEMLRNSSIDKKLLLVEHNPIASQAIESKITVVRDGLTSQIMQ